MQTQANQTALVQSLSALPSVTFSEHQLVRAADAAAEVMGGLELPLDDTTVAKTGKALEYITSLFSPDNLVLLGTRIKQARKLTTRLFPEPRDDLKGTVFGELQEQWNLLQLTEIQGESYPLQGILVLEHHIQVYNLHVELQAALKQRTGKLYKTVLAEYKKHVRQHVRGTYPIETFVHIWVVSDLGRREHVFVGTQNMKELKEKSGIYKRTIAFGKAVNGLAACGVGILALVPKINKTLFATVRLHGDGNADDKQVHARDWRGSLHPCGLAACRRVSGPATGNRAPLRGGCGANPPRRVAAGGDLP